VRGDSLREQAVNTMHLESLQTKPILRRPWRQADQPVHGRGRGPDRWQRLSVGWQELILTMSTAAVPVIAEESRMEWGPTSTGGWCRRHPLMEEIPQRIRR